VLGGENADFSNYGGPISQAHSGLLNVPPSQLIVPMDPFGYQISSGGDAQLPHSSQYDELGYLGPQQVSSGASQPMVQHSSSYRQPNTNQDHQTSPQQWGYRPPGSQMAGDPNLGSLDSSSCYQETDYANINWVHYNEGP